MVKRHPVTARQLGASTLAAFVFLSLPAGVLLLARAPLTEAVHVERVFAALGVTAGGLGCLVSARATGRAFDGWAGVTLAVSGALVAATADLPLFGLAPTADGRALQSLVTAVALAPLWVRSYQASEVEAGLRPLRLISLGVIGAVTGIAGIGLLARHGLLLPTVDGTGWRDVLAASAACWLACALQAGLLAPRRQLPRWPAAVPVAAGLAALLRLTLTPAADAPLLAGLLAGLAAALVVAGAGLELRHLLRFLDRRDLGLRMDLDSARREMEDQRAQLHEQLHDLRNAVSALRCADTTLRTRAEHLDPASRAALADAMSLELARLQVLIEPGRPAVATDFDLGDALEAVVTAERNLGAAITLAVDGVRAHGDATGLAQVVQNLLVNARRYAPGARVLVSAKADAASGRVALLVSDDGPGIPEAERDRIFLRGARGSTAVGTAGDGLGLHVARRLVAASGGQLALVDRPGPGACFLIDLPAPAAETTLSPAPALSSAR